MIKVKCECTECDHSFEQLGDMDDGAFVDHVFAVAQDHADAEKHKVSFVRHGHSPKEVKPRARTPYGRSTPLLRNPLNDSYV